MPRVSASAVMGNGIPSLHLTYQQQCGRLGVVKSDGPELSARLTMYRLLDVRVTFINWLEPNLKKSAMPLGAVRSWSADEVAGWLRTQELSDAVVATFVNVTGSDLVDFTAEDIADAVGPMKAKAILRKIQALVTRATRVPTAAPTLAPPPPLPPAPAPTPISTPTPTPTRRACYAGCDLVRKPRESARPPSPSPVVERERTKERRGVGEGEGLPDPHAHTHTHTHTFHICRAHRPASTSSDRTRAMRRTLPWTHPSLLPEQSLPSSAAPPTCSY